MFVISLLYSLLVLSQGKTNRAYWSYIDKYKNMAIEQQIKYKIPASITLAQGLLESAAGTSRLAVKANNHFGIKAHGGWTGPYIRVDDDLPNEKFRKYKSVRDSYEDHSMFLLKPRYERLFKYRITDYKSWAKGLKACGYATSPTYASNLIRIIEMYSLHQFDKVKTIQQTTTPSSPATSSTGTKTSSNKYSISDIERLSIVYLKRLANHKIKESKLSEFFRTHTVYKNNHNYFIIVQNGDNLAAISRATGLTIHELMDFNDLAKNYTLSVGDIIYLRKKKKRASSEYKNKPHQVQEGQSMYDISQMYGIRLKNLYILNGLSPREYHIKVGDLIWLR